MAHNLAAFCCMTILLSMASTTWASSLEVGFYQQTCPSAEGLIRKVVSHAVAQDSGIAAGLIRLHFHDCFVRGCDASVLLDPIPGIRVEKQAGPNLSLRGFEVIDVAKAAVEAMCPTTVSCADILAFAARDAAYLASGGGIDWPVQAGRRDGRRSLETEALDNLPPPNATASILKDMFARKWLSLDEMVTLSGAHSIGRTLCRPIASRLYNFSPSQPQDPSLDPAFAAYLKTKCPPSSLDPNANDQSRVMLDDKTPYKLDNQYYKNLMRNKGVLTSDQTLQTSPLTSDLVLYDAKHGSDWADKFAKAMMKMGTIEVLTGYDGEVRHTCQLVNAY